jgi:glyoxylase-like metal-dependent hydrolase (beta-lactamase superfamily II)
LWLAAAGLPAILATTFAQNAPAPAAEFHVLPVQGNVYMLVGPQGNTTVQVPPATAPPPRIPGVYQGSYGIFVVDTQGPGTGQKLLAEIRKISPAPIRFVVNTHNDRDHIGGNAELAKAPARRGGGAGGDPTLVVAHENVLLQLAEPEAKTPEGAVPTDAYLDTREIWLNNESIQLIHQPNAHSDGDTLVYFRRSDVISAGDIFSTTTYPVIDRAHGGTVEGIISGLNRILDIAIPESNQEGGTRIVPGHGRLSDEADVVEYRNMVVMIRDRIKALVAKGMTLDQVKAARTTLDYDFRYGKDKAWTPDMFVSAIYAELKKGTQ